MTNVTVRACTAHDLAVLEAREVRPGSGFARSNLALAEAGRLHFIAAFTEDDVAGFVLLDTDEVNELRPEMQSLWVYPTYRRQGIGEMLTASIEAIAREQGFDEVFLGVNPDNPAAIPMYIGLAYKPTGDHRFVTDEVTGVEQHEAIYRKSLRTGR